MGILRFSIKIDAGVSKVWETLWGDSTYRKWTAAFSEGTYAESDWNEGSKIRFFDPNGNGMFGIIENKINHEQITFRYLGEIRNGKEELRDWKEAIETYYLTAANGIAELNVELNAPAEMEPYLNHTFSKALEILKKISVQ